MSESPFKIFIVSTTVILLVFGIAIGGFFVYREIQKRKSGKTCVIRIRQGDPRFHAEGKLLSKPELYQFISEKKKAWEKYMGTGNMKAPDFMLIFEIDEGCVYEDLHGALEVLTDKYLLGKVTIAAPGKPGTVINIPAISGEAVFMVKLLWYSPYGNPRYNGPDGAMIVKYGGPRSPRILDWIPDKDGKVQPDWKTLSFIVNETCSSYRPPPEYPDRSMNLILQCRRKVPMRYFLDALAVLKKTGAQIYLSSPEERYNW